MGHGHVLKVYGGMRMEIWQLEEEGAPTSPP